MRILESENGPILVWTAPLGFAALAAPWFIDAENVNGCFCVDAQDVNRKSFPGLFLRHGLRPEHLPKVWELIRAPGGMNPNPKTAHGYLLAEGEGTIDEAAFTDHVLRFTRARPLLA